MARIPLGWGCWQMSQRMVPLRELPVLQGSQGRRGPNDPFLARGSVRDTSGTPVCPQESLLRPGCRPRGVSLILLSVEHLLPHL